MLKRKIQDLTICLTYNFSCLHSPEHSLKAFRMEYRLLEEIGRGGFGIVYKGFRVRDHKPVAVKYIQHKHVREWTITEAFGQQIPSEVCYLEECKGINGVVKLVDWFASSKGFMIVMERPQHFMDLFDVVAVYGRLDETVARTFFVQLVDTVLELYEKHSLIHRDIKDENVIVNMDTGQIKLVDFGAADFLDKAKKKEFQGTKSYCPPEWFKRRSYLPLESTVWSLGVLLHILVTGNTPYKNEIQICVGRLKFPEFVSLDCQHLIRQCLNPCPANRLSLKGIREHLWTCKEDSLLTSQKAIRNFSPYSQENPFQAVLHRRSIKRKQRRQRDAQAAEGCVTDCSESDHNTSFDSNSQGGEETVSEMECSYRQPTPTIDGKKVSSSPKPILVPQSVLDAHARALAAAEEARARAASTYQVMEDQSSYYHHSSHPHRSSFSSDGSCNPSALHAIDSSISDFETAAESGFGSARPSCSFSPESALFSSTYSQMQNGLWESALSDNSGSMASSQYFSTFSASSASHTGLNKGVNRGLAGASQKKKKFEYGGHLESELFASSSSALTSAKKEDEEEDEKTVVPTSRPTTVIDNTGISCPDYPSSSNEEELITVCENSNLLTPTPPIYHHILPEIKSQSSQCTPTSVHLRKQTRRRQEQLRSIRALSTGIDGGNWSSSDSDTLDAISEWTKCSRPLSVPYPKVNYRRKKRKRTAGDQENTMFFPADNNDNNNNQLEISSMQPLPNCNPTSQIPRGVKDTATSEEKRQQSLPSSLANGVTTRNPRLEKTRQQSYSDEDIAAFQPSGLQKLERLEKELKMLCN